MATQINISCIDQTLTLTGTPVVASGGINEDIIKFTFSNHWDGFGKTCVFYKDKGSIYYSVLNNNNEAVVPKEVINTSGTMYLGVVGVNGNVQRTSQIIRYRVDNGALNGFTIEEPTPSMYQQILTAYGTISAMIPSQASSSNQLADKAFVNSSISTSTAYFRGTFNIVDDLELTRTATHAQVATALASAVSVVTNNDYVFVSIPNATTATQIDQYDRYKYTIVGSTGSWAYEYTLNNSSFTAQQWNALNSGITSDMVGHINDNDNAIKPMLNLWDEEWELGIYDVYNTGGKVVATDQIRCKNRIKVYPNENVYLYNNAVNYYILCYDANDAYIGGQNVGWFYKLGGQSFAVPSNCYYIRFYVGSAYGTSYNNNISINYPSSYTGYYSADLSKKIDPSKVINLLTSLETDKPLSAYQGKVLKDLIDKMKNTRTITLGTNWSSLYGYNLYTQDIEIDGLTANDKVEIEPIYTDKTLYQIETIEDELAKIKYYETKTGLISSGRIVFYAEEATTQSIQLLVKGF